MSEQQDASSSSNKRNPTSPAAMSGIDWSIFKDGEEDAFGWLLRNNAAGATSARMQTSPQITRLAIFYRPHDGGGPGMGQLQMTKGQAVAQSNARLLAVAVVRGSAVLAVQADVNFMSMLPNMGLFDNSNISNEEEKDGKQSAAKRWRLLREQARRSEEAKKQMRRVKNLVSVREFRKRKTKQLEQNEARLRRLEAENMDLKMRLKIGKEAILSEQREKKQIKEQMREMLQRNANEQEIAQFLNMYKVTYSDYGPKRREKLHFHLSRIRELLLPTQVTKLSLYSVEQGVDMLRRDHVIKEDPMSAPESATATMSLWGILADELEVSDEQQRQILERRAAIKKVRDDLNHTLSIVKKLEEVTDEKNTALEAQVAQLQQILTPSQATKFIIWVKENPAFMYMLDKLVDSTLQNNTNSAEE
ncbi:P-loop containing nucleoside triphosphate hydrolase [Phytophthora cactorum]|nr:P-loop containing nucleoside triphosphate hydrolase [Phytophthora cactorum]